MRLFTIGFTQRSAEDFFMRLQEAGVKRVVDIRLHNTSQIAGFAKSRDLAYFLDAIAHIDYEHMTAFAPTQELLDFVRKKKGDWKEYERRFNQLLHKRDASAPYGDLRDGDCLLCSEYEPDHCHRRLVAEYLKQKRRGTEIIHL